MSVDGVVAQDVVQYPRQSQSVTDGEFVFLYRVSNFSLTASIQESMMTIILQSYKRVSCHVSDYSDADYYNYHYADPVAPEGASVPINTMPVSGPRPLSVTLDVHADVDGVLVCLVRWQAGRPQDYVLRWEREQCQVCRLADPRQRLATVIRSEHQVRQVALLVPLLITYTC